MWGECFVVCPVILGFGGREGCVNHNMLGVQFALRPGGSPSPGPEASILTTLTTPLSLLHHSWSPPLSLPFVWMYYSH